MLDIANEQVHLYGDAVVTHKTMKLTADYIIFDWGKNIVTAQGALDSVGKMAGFPVFKDTDQNFNAKKIRYNFKSKRGVVYDTQTKEQDVYVLGKKGAFIAKDPGEGRNKDVIFNENAIFTTCNHPKPHFGIRSSKQKVVPNEVVVVGASNLEIGGVPTPLWLPFAFFPLKKGRRTGLIFPRDYEYSENRGFGLRDVGWYFPMSDYWDLTVLGDVYTRGTWELICLLIIADGTNTMVGSPWAFSMKEEKSGGRRLIPVLFVLAGVIVRMQKHTRPIVSPLMSIFKRIIIRVSPITQHRPFFKIP